MTATQRVPSIRTALVVDDEPHVVELISDALTSEGFAVTSATDGPAALRRARASQPDVVVLDVGLPGLDGYEVCRALRKQASSGCNSSPVSGSPATLGALTRLVSPR